VSIRTPRWGLAMSDVVKDHVCESREGCGGVWQVEVRRCRGWVDTAHEGGGRSSARALEEENSASQRWRQVGQRGSEGRDKLVMTPGGGHALVTVIMAAAHDGSDGTWYNSGCARWS
jgi:hypothetical protein